MKSFWDRESFSLPVLERFIEMIQFRKYKSATQEVMHLYCSRVHKNSSKIKKISNLKSEISNRSPTFAAPKVLSFKNY
jgi:hypothetical protein